MIDYFFEEVTSWEQLECEKPEIAERILSLPLVEIISGNERRADHADCSLLIDLQFVSEIDGRFEIEDSAAVCRAIGKQFSQTFSAREPESIDEIVRELEAANRIRLRSGAGRSAIGDSMVLLFRAAEWDVLAIAQKYFRSKQPFGVFWRALAYAIPFGNCDNTDALADVLGMAVQNATNGGSGFSVYTSARQLATNDETRGRKLLQYLRTDWNHSAADIVPSLAIGLADSSSEDIVEELFGWLEQEDEYSVAAGIRALNGLNCDEEQRMLVSKRLVDCIGEPTIVRQQIVLRAVTDALRKLAKFAMPESSLKSWVAFLSSTTDADLCQRTASLLLHIQGEFGGEDWFRHAVLAIYKQAPTDIALLHQLCLVVKETESADGNFSFANTAIETWLLNVSQDSNPPSVTDAFLFVFQGMYAKSTEHTNSLLTRWMSSDDRRLHDAAEELGDSVAVSALDGASRNYSFDPQLLKDSKKQDLEYLVRKTMSLLDEPRMLSSMIFSLVECETLASFEERKNIVAWCFFNFVGYNFPATSEKFLKLKLEEGTDQEKAAAQLSLDAMDQYYAPLQEETPKELQPPFSQVQLYADGFQAVMKESEKKAMAESPLLSIMPSIRLLFGNQYIHDGMSKFQNGEKNLQSGRLAEHSIEWEPPRQHVIDPVGYVHQRQAWRKQKRDETPCN